MKRAALFVAVIAIAACGGNASPPAAAPKPEASAAPAASTTAVAFAEAEPVAQATVSLSGAQDNINARARVKPEPFRVSDLPLANLPEPLPPASAPSSAPTGEAASEIVLEWPKTQGVKAASFGADTRATVRADMKGKVIGRLRIGFSENAIGDVSGSGTGGVFVTCGGGDLASKKPLPARWETLESAGGGLAKFTVGNGWFDSASCKVIVVARQSVVAKPLASGAMFAFRQTCPACAAGEWLVILTPRAAKMAATGIGGDATTQLGPFSRIVLPLRRGGGGSMMGRITSNVLHDWSQTLSLTPPAESEILVGVELTQAVSDDEPVAISYIGVPADPAAAKTGLDSRR